MANRVTSAELGRELAAAVQCRSTLHNNWETIAAFDVTAIARTYCNQCEAENPDRKYRVVPVAI